MSFVLKAVNTAFFLLCSMYNSAAARENTVFPAFIFEWRAILNLAEGFLCDSAAARENTAFPALIFEWRAILNLAEGLLGLEAVNMVIFDLFLEV